jgi:hypothetical protein
MQTRNPGGHRGRIQTTTNSDKDDEDTIEANKLNGFRTPLPTPRVILIAHDW